MLAEIELAQGDIATLANRDALLAEATFGEFRISPILARRLADSILNQIEFSRIPSVRRSLAAQVIEGLSSPTLSTKVSRKLGQWFPRSNSYGSTRVFQVIGNWPEDPNIELALWRGLRDENYPAAQAAAQSMSKRFGGRSDLGEKLCELISNPPHFTAAAAAIEALWRGWPEHAKLADILNLGRRSANVLVAIAAIRGRVGLKIHDDDDFSHLTDLGENGDYRSNEHLETALVEGWKGDDRLRAYATRSSRRRDRGSVGRLRPDFGLLIQAFPADPQVAELIARDFKQEHPHCLFDHEDFASLATHFRDDPVVGAAVETWVMQHRIDDAFTLARAARVTSTPKFKGALLKCLKAGHLAFWAASALVDLWGAHDDEVRTALIAAADKPVNARQNTAHVLPLVISDRDRCRELLLEIVESPGRIRADFALEGLRRLGVNASDRDAKDRVLTRGYDEERFVVENEAREVILTFYGDQRVYELAKRQLRRPFGAIGTVAEVFSTDAEMRQLVLDASGPLDIDMRLTILEQLSFRAAFDPISRSLIAAAREDESDDIVVESSIALARANKAASVVSDEYIAEIQRELDAVGPRLDGRRQGAFAALAALGKLDLLPGEGEEERVRNMRLFGERQIFRFIASDWAAIVEGLGGEDAALERLAIGPEQFFSVFEKYLDASREIRDFAIKLADARGDCAAPAGAIWLLERARPRSGFLRELCLNSINFNGRTNWESFRTAIIAGEVLGRNFSGDPVIEDRLAKVLEASPFNDGAVAALCEGWPRSVAMNSLCSRLEKGRVGLPTALAFRVMSVRTEPARLVENLTWAADSFEGDLWEAIPYWMPSVVRRLRDDDEACAKMRERIFSPPSPGVKASFPRMLGRARGRSEELRSWCQAECRRSETDLVGEVGFDLIAGQQRLVVQSLFDFLVDATPGA